MVPDAQMVVNKYLWNEWIKETKKLYKNGSQFLKDFTSDKYKPRYTLKSLDFLSSLDQWLFLLLSKDIFLSQPNFFFYHD